MVEEDVLVHLQSLLRDGGATSSVASCRVSTPLQHPWGRAYRLVEWTTPLDDGARRQVVPAESTALEIARLVAQHVPGRRILLNGEPVVERPRGRRRRSRSAASAHAAR
ncbi:DUF2866 domain-containing protein [Paraburkholderia acidisoli]|uniref:DUF2866 domain-containing protein n=1 Tax=Paraburkholderia acidisoli TaxID=2571748 RepID=A0A7Z2GM08_9BURK|nr:DUF2866 domain-containing protein [Paraburkholderia acidisoli]